MSEAIQNEFREFRTQLASGGMIHPASYGGADVWTGRFDSLIRSISKSFGAQVVPSATGIFRFSPTLPRVVIDQTGYPDTFPHLAGLIAPPEPIGSEALRREVALPGAACHPVFGTLERSSVTSMQALWAEGWVFRHEPSSDPMRMMSFRQTEAVFIGDPHEVGNSITAALDRCADMLAAWGIHTLNVPASDSFAGRLADFRTQLQLEAATKRELVHQVWKYSDSGTTALASGNLHGTRFGRLFDIHYRDRTIAATGCVGLGLERTALTLLRTHGVNLSRWPAELNEIVHG